MAVINSEITISGRNTTYVIKWACIVGAFYDANDASTVTRSSNEIAA